MLLFVSDLHLSDRRETSGADVATLLAELENTLGRAFEQGVKRAQLVLLGDIFELLKSERWLATEARPWLPPSLEAAAVVNEVFAAIVVEHASFFSGLAALIDRFPGLELQYLPGNHDREMNTPLGTEARRRLRRLLCLPGRGEERFSRLVVDLEHSVLAKHGHEWDPQNRYSPPFAAIGDVVVIELVTRLPFLVRQSLGAELSFLEELDNVRPQHPRAMAQWLLVGLARLGAKKKEARKAVGEALGVCVPRFIQALSQARFEAAEKNPWKKALTNLPAGLASRTKLWTLVSRLPRPRPAARTVSGHAQFDLETAALKAATYRYCVSGHTHRAETVPLSLFEGSGAERALYLNTGTWRRVHTLIEPVGEARPDFATWNEGCLVKIFSPDEQGKGLPPFEVRTHQGGLARGC